MMAVYLIRAGEVGPVKIGCAASPMSRLSILQCAHHEKLSILRLFQGMHDEERMLQGMFAACRIRGEWFRFSERMLGDISSLVETTLDEIQAANSVEEPYSEQPPLGYDKKTWRQSLRIWRTEEGAGTPFEIYDLISQLASSGSDRLL